MERANLQSLIAVPCSSFKIDFVFENAPRFSCLNPGIEELPIPEGLAKEYAAYIMGGQANVWTEYMHTPAHVEYMAYPRACALAEKLWTPENICDYDDFIHRLIPTIKRLKKQGVHVADCLFDVQAEISETGNTVQLTLFTDNPAAQIRFTDDGTEPTLKSKLYTVPLILDTAKTIKAAAFLDGQKVGYGFAKTFDIH